MSFYGEKCADSDEITRAYLDSLLLETRYLDAELPSTEIKLFGETFETPIMTAALSHLHNICENAMAEFGKGACDAGALHWVGMGEDKELEDILATGAKTIKIIKPHADNNEVFRKIEHAVKHGAIAVGMDIDHAFSGQGGYDNVFGLEMRPKSTAELKEFVQAAGVPFVVKGVLSVQDAERSVEAGAAGILLSHHHNMMSYSVPPLMVLPEIAKAVDGAVPIFVDCGIVSGMDVYKALALGATAVGVGRELMGPLKDGAKGVTERIQQMNQELMSIMARTGVKSLADMDASVLHARTF